MPASISASSWLPGQMAGMTMKFSAMLHTYELAHHAVQPSPRLYRLISMFAAMLEALRRLMPAARY